MYRYCFTFDYMKTPEQFDAELNYQVEKHFGTDWHISPATIVSNLRNDNTIEGSLVLINKKDIDNPKLIKFTIDFNSHISPQEQLSHSLLHPGK